MLVMADRLVAAMPGDAKSWRMHASAHSSNIQNWPAASRSCVKAARLFGDHGNDSSKAVMQNAAEQFRKKAEAEAKAAVTAEAAHMAAREAAANAAMEALLAEEEHEKVATAKSGKGKVKKGKGHNK